MLPILATGVFVLGFIILGTRLLGIAEIVVNRGADAGQVLMLIVYLLPRILLLALPAAALMSSLLAFIRLSSDNETIALMSSGISLYQILPPVLVFSAGACMLAGATSMVGVPWGNRSVKDAVYKIAESGVNTGLKERVFCEPFRDVMFYVHDLSSGEGVMRDVFAVDKRTQDMVYTIVARKGLMLHQPEQRVILVRFQDGTIFVDERGMESVRTVEFKTYDLRVGLEDIMESIKNTATAPKEMRVGELVERLGQAPPGSGVRNELLVELLERVTLPLGVFLLGVVGLPLGTHLRARAYSTGIGVSLVVFLAYYTIFVGVRSLCETGRLDPATGMWIPNIFLLASCAYLTEVAAKDKPLPFSPEAPLGRRLSAGWDRISGLARARLRPQAERRPQQAAYVGNARRERFHRSDCRCLQRLAAGNRRTFESREEAVQAGYEACKVCRP